MSFMSLLRDGIRVQLSPAARCYGLRSGCSGGRQLGRDAGEDRVDLATRGRECDYGDERDEQRVLDQVLAVFLAKKIANERVNLHVLPPARPAERTLCCGFGGRALHDRTTLLSATGVPWLS